MLGAVNFLICLLALMAGMEIRSPGTLHAVIEAATITMTVAHDHVGADICAKLTALGRPIAACSVV